MAHSQQPANHQCMREIVQLHLVKNACNREMKQSHARCLLIGHQREVRSASCLNFKSDLKLKSTPLTSSPCSNLFASRTNSSMMKSNVSPLGKNLLWGIKPKHQRAHQVLRLGRPFAPALPARFQPTDHVNNNVESSANPVPSSPCTQNGNVRPSRMCGMTAGQHCFILRC